MSAPKFDFEKLRAAVESTGNLETKFRFLLVYDTATLDFSLDGEQCVEYAKKASEMDISYENLRQVMRQGLIDGMLVNDHLKPESASKLAAIVAAYCFTSQSVLELIRLRHTGFVVEITEVGGHDRNVRTIGCPPDYVDERRDQLRKGVGNIVTHDPDKKVRRSKIPANPSLEPPPRPRPEQFLDALVTVETKFGKVPFVSVRECIEKGAIYIFKSNQFAEGSEQEIDESLSALALFDRLVLPHPFVYIETRDWFEFYKGDSLTKNDVRLGIAAWEEDEDIKFCGMIENAALQRTVAPMFGTVGINSLKEGSRHISMMPPPIPKNAYMDEYLPRAITAFAGNRLLELLFLLTCQGVERTEVDPNLRIVKESVRDRRNQKGQKKLRPYSVIRVPYFQETHTDHGGGMTVSGGKTRWIKPHLRAAHIWGRFTRPPEEQRLVEATLVNAKHIREGEDTERPVHLVKLPGK